MNQLIQHLKYYIVLCRNHDLHGPQKPLFHFTVRQLSCGNVINCKFVCEYGSVLDPILFVCVSKLLK